MSILNIEVQPIGRGEPTTPQVEAVPLPPVGPTTAYGLVDTNTLLTVRVSREAFEHWHPSGAVFHGSDRRPVFALPPAAGVRMVTLVVSDACNLRCNYCFVQRQHHRGNWPVMTVETARAAVGMIESGRPLRVGLFGGEPLMELPLLQEIVREVRCEADRRHVACHVSLTTNATLIDRPMAEYIVHQDMSVIVSCDGPHDLHDASRGAGTHAAVKFGLAELERAGGAVRTVLRGTFPTVSELRRRLDYLNLLCDAGLAVDVALEPADVLTESPDLEVEVHAATELLINRAHTGEAAHWRPLTTLLGRLLWCRRHGSECGAGRAYVTIGPEGGIYACHRRSGQPIGQIDGAAVRWDEAERARWADNRLEARQGCPTCWIRYLCGGGCRAESLDCGAGLTEPLSVRCRFMRALAREAVWMAAELPREALVKLCVGESGGRGVRSVSSQSGPGISRARLCTPSAVLTSVGDGTALSGAPADCEGRG
jgi:uncharacterized protein